jgi:hypothetical protein
VTGASRRGGGPSHRTEAGTVGPTTHPGATQTNTNTDAEDPVRSA